MKHSVAVLAVVSVFSLTLTVAQAQTVVVTPSDLDGWTPTTSGTANGDFVAGPGLPPLGFGSFELSVGPNGDDAAQLRNADFAGVPLADLTELTYSTYVQVDGSGGQAPYIILNVDYNGDTATDDLLFFEPVYQTAVFFPSNPQPALLLATWQEWDALNGGWWSLSGTAGAGPGTNVKSLDDILAVEPDAAISAGGAGSVRLVAGFGAGAWDNFVGNVDAVTVGVNSAAVTYDFEATVIIDGCDTGVSDIVVFLDEDGNPVYLSDMIADIALTAKNHGQFVKGVAALTNDLKKSGLLSGEEKGAIQSCAAQSSLP